MKVEIYYGEIILCDEVFLELKTKLLNYDFYEVDGSFVWYSKDGLSRLQLYKNGRFEVRRGVSILELNHYRYDVGTISCKELMRVLKGDIRSDI